ncbi:MAG: glycoside hydrolase family 53 protein [Bacillota bacterium]
MLKLYFSILILVFLVVNPVRMVRAAEEYGEDFIRGADISMLGEIEKQGGTYYNREGEECDLLKILREHGINYIRLRLWKDPGDRGGGNNDLEQTLALAERVKEHDLKLLLDFHYSDWWADPETQDKPAVWEDLDYPELKEEVYQYTKEVITEFKSRNLLPDMVQIGNEIRSGILWPEGKTWGPEAGGFDRLAELLKMGIKGVQDSLDQGEDIEIMLHTDQGGSISDTRWLFDQILARDVEFDIIGLSFYPYWHGTVEDLKNNMQDIVKRYEKDVVVAEFSYAWTLEKLDNHKAIFGPEQEREGGYSATRKGQIKAIKDVKQVVANIPRGRGRGVFYWEPAWIPVDGAGWKKGEGSSWANQTLFDFDGYPLDSLEVFGQ